MIATLSSLGLPLLNGFIGEFVILRGTYEVNIKYVAWAVIALFWELPTFCGSTSA